MVPGLALGAAGAGAAAAGAAGLVSNRTDGVSLGSLRREAAKGYLLARLWKTSFAASK